MKKILLVLISFVPAILLAQTPCSGGMAGSYPCDGYDLMSHIDLTTMNANSGNDSWGWTDPMNGDEYAIIGLNNGTAFIDISDPVNPVYKGKLPTHTTSSTWRDIKTYQNHAFIVSEASGHGMQVFDLTKLRNSHNPTIPYSEDAYYSGFGNAHNIAINKATGYAYAIGTSTFNGGPHFINIQNPTNPTAAGGFGTEGYTHDAQIVIYSGPDSDYTGSEIFFGCNEDSFVIVDVTDKNNPVTLANVGYSNVGYTHQGWLTEDQTYFLLGDEFDEITTGVNSRTIVFDVSDLDNPQVHFEYSGPTPAVDHNGYIKGDKFYLSNYTAGLRILDISDLANQNMTEIGSFDTYPSDNSAAFEGSWSNYPFFDSGNIVISDINQGFFLVRDSNLGVEDISKNQRFALYPNPAAEKATLVSETIPIRNVLVYNMMGQQIMDLKFSENRTQTLDVSSLPTGVYLLRINGTTSKRLVVK